MDDYNPSDIRFFVPDFLQGLSWVNLKYLAELFEHIDENMLAEINADIKRRLKSRVKMFQ